MGQVTEVPQARQRRHRYAFPFIGIVLLSALIYLLGPVRILDALRRTDPAWVVASGALIAAGLWIRVWKWRIALGPGSRATYLFYISKGAGEWTPGRLGEFAPLLVKENRTTKVAAWILLDRLLEISATLGICAVGFVLLPFRVQAPFAMALAVLGGVLAFVVFAAGHSPWHQALACRMPRGSRLQRAFLTTAQLAGDVRTFHSKSPLTIGITVLAGCCDVWAGKALFLAFDRNVPFAPLAAARGVHSIVATIPITPNSTGVPYVSAAAMVHELAGVPNDVLAVATTLSIAVTTCIFWGSFAVGTRNSGNTTVDADAPVTTSKIH
ncbi:MAG: hypothetical protein AMXMBFR84_34410 [Candidatus Hydrogenedentota bacterium]